MLINRNNQNSENFVKEFLSYFPGHIVQTLDDKSLKGATPFRQALPELVSSSTRFDHDYEDLKRFNNAGAGLYFAYNNFKEKRTKENVIGINAWAMEIDDLPKDEQKKLIVDCPMLPSFIVETRKSLHCYWLAKDGKTKNAKDINTRLQQYFNSDTALKDTARMLRIPGFFHNKQEPFFVKLIHDDNDEYFTEHQMLSAFPLTPNIEYTKNYIMNPFWAKAGNIPVKQSLIRLSGTKIVNNEVFSFRQRAGGGEYIDIDGLPADCWLDEKGLIGSGKGAGPTIVQWLKFYGHDTRTVATWLKDNCSDLIPAGSVEFDLSYLLKRTETKDEDDIINTDKRVFTWGTTQLNENITPINGVVMFSGATGSGKTTFCTFVALENVKLNNKVLFLSFEMSEDEIYTRFARAQAGITKNQWRDKSLISEDQKAVYLHKKEELKKTDNLYLRGFQKHILPTTENIFKIIDFLKPDLVFIDNFDLIFKKEGAEYEEQNRVSAELKEYAQSTRIPLIILHHQKTGAFDKSKRTNVDLLRGSGKIEHNAYAHISGTRFYGDEATEKEKCLFSIKEHKDREFGGNSTQIVYFRKGAFYDEHIDPDIQAHYYN